MNGKELQEILNEFKLTHLEFAKIVGVSKSSIDKACEGKAKIPIKAVLFYEEKMQTKN